MNDLFLFAAHNSIAALLFAFVVYALTRIWRSPPFAHLLWLLVLLRFLAPPVVSLELPLLQPAEQTSAANQVSGLVLPDVKLVADMNSVGTDTLPSAVSRSAVSLQSPDLSTGQQPFWVNARPFVFWIWVAGVVVCVLVAVKRIFHFQRLLKETLPSPAAVHGLTREIADRMGVRRVPDVRYVESAEVPMVWCLAGRATCARSSVRTSRIGRTTVALPARHQTIGTSADST